MHTWGYFVVAVGILGHHTHVWILSHSLDPDSGHSPCPQRPQLCILVRPPCHPRCSQDMTSLSALLSTKHCLDPMVSWTGARGRGKSWWDAYKMRLLLAQTTAVGHQGLHSPTPLPMLPFRPLVNMEGPLCIAEGHQACAGATGPVRLLGKLPC